MLEKNIHKDLDFNGISYNSNFKIEMLEKFPDKDWDFGQGGISSNTALTLEMLEKFPNKNWYFGEYGISSNPALTLEILEKIPNKNWYFREYGISSNPALTLEILEKYINKRWKLKGHTHCISSNKAFTPEMFEKYPKNIWQFRFISENPNITIKFIKKNINKFNFRGLSSNHFTYIKKLFKKVYQKTKLFYYLYFTKLIYDLQRYSITTF